MSHRACLWLVLMAGLAAGTGIQLRAETRPPTQPHGPAGPPSEPVLVRPVLPSERIYFPGEDRGRTGPRTRQYVDVARAQREAKELVALAEKIPGQVNELPWNVLPKDSVRQLRRIEQLAKHLRKEISREGQRP
jgi:hypothetical protein